MENYDSILTEQGAKDGKSFTPFDKDAWIQQKQAERQSAFERMDQTAAEIATNGDLFQSCLDVMARFDRYSVGNILLLTSQMPEATKLADFNTWKKSRCFIKKGENSIMLLEPGEEFRREDGSMGVNYNVKRVFDISQTTAVAAETKITHDPRRLLEALVRNAPCPIEIRNNPQAEYAARFDPQSRKIYVKQGLDADTLFRCITQEVAVAEYAKGHRKRSECDFDASCIAYILCKRFGVSTDSFSFDKLPERLSRTENKAVHAELDGIREIANRLSEGMQQMLAPRQRSDKNRDAR